MRSNLRWVALASLVLNLLLLQVIKQQTGNLTELRNRDNASTYHSVIAELEAENEASRIELAVLDVLDSHRLRVAPETRQQIAATIVQAGHRYDLAPELILGVIFTESSFNIDAESEVGALGLMQLMPDTASELAHELEMEWKGRQLLTDPQANILMGSFYLRKLLHRFDDLDQALAAYNVGPNRLQSMMRESGHVPRRYARKVQSVTADLRERFF